MVAYSRSKVLKKVKKLLGKFISSPRFFLIVGIFLMLYGGINYWRLRILSFTSAPDSITSVQKGDLPVQIIIPSVGIDLPVEVGGIKGGVWQISYDKATFLGSSAGLGTGGNTVIYGHNKKAIFGNLPYLSLGQKIIVKTQSGELKNYEAYWKDFVKPDRVDLVSATDNEELTIYTCWGTFDQTRAVIKARPIN